MLNAEMISNVVDVELILEGIKYSVKVSRVQLTGIYMYNIILLESHDFTVAPLLF